MDAGSILSISFQNYNYIKEGVLSAKRFGMEVRMRNLKKNAVAVIMILMFVLVGCGSKEVIMKEFTSEDQTVSIQMNEEWKVEDMGDGSEGWIAALSDDESQGMIVMQLSKSLYGGNITDIEGVKEIVVSSYTISDQEPVENPSVPGMDVKETYSCVMSADGVTGKGRVLYGETEYAYYSILYVADRINDAGIEYFNKACGSFKETAPEIEAAASTDTIQWFNNTCAVLTALNGWDYTVFGGLPAEEGSKGIAQSLLNEWWDVTDKASADETMEWLLEEGHRISFAENMAYLAESGLTDVSADERVDAILDYFELNEEEAQNYANLFAFYEQYGADAAAGWDYSRAMSLLGYYYLAGYYTEAEALDKSLETAEIIQATFDSWDELMESYFIGYEYWAEESSADRRELYEEIKASDDNPFQLDWNMTFEKSW